MLYYVGDTAEVTQLIERLPSTQKVAGLSPVFRSITFGCTTIKLLRLSSMVKYDGAGHD